MKIIKQTGGFYYVDTGKEILECRGRGKFRNDSITPLVGDNVEVTDKFVSKILPRKNELKRPQVSNVDLLVMVVSTLDPKPNYFVIDKITAICEYQDIPVVFIMTKTDLDSGKEFRETYEKAGYTVLDKHKDDIKSIFKDKFCVLCGNSGVGKSTLINELDPSLKLETNDISKALGRGKHTTRTTELYKLCGGLICDTPGFSDIEVEDIPYEKLELCFPDFTPYILKCKFTGCSHTGELGCEVCKNVLPSRLESYRGLYNEAKIRDNRYDVRSMSGKRSKGNA